VATYERLHYRRVAVNHDLLKRLVAIGKSSPDPKQIACLLALERHARPSARVREEIVPDLMGKAEAFQEPQVIRA
jgi:hypothetical protein